MSWQDDYELRGSHPDTFTRKLRLALEQLNRCIAYVDEAHPAVRQLIGDALRTSATKMGEALYMESCREGEDWQNRPSPRQPGPCQLCCGAGWLPMANHQRQPCYRCQGKSMQRAEQAPALPKCAWCQGRGYLQDAEAMTPCDSCMGGGVLRASDR